MPTVIVREPERTVARDGTVTIEPGLIEVTGASRVPAEADGWLSTSHAARRLGVESRAVHDALAAGLVPVYVTARGPRRWCRADDLDRLRVRGLPGAGSKGGKDYRGSMVTELYLPGGGEERSSAE